jgi:diguanylate cyclase (GGDEF)-like protein
LGSVIKRPSDLISRYGGTKFAALLPDTDSVGAAWLAECFRRAVIDLALPHEYSPVVQHVSISVGHATRTANPEHLSQQLLEAADMALLKAKEAGRNLTWEG